jgi:hypothetical protein
MFKVRHIDKYDGSSNPEKFIQVYILSSRPQEEMVG